MNEGVAPQQAEGPERDLTRQQETPYSQPTTHGDSADYLGTSSAPVPQAMEKSESAERGELVVVETKSAHKPLVGKSLHSGALTRWTAAEPHQVQGFIPTSRRIVIGAGKAGVSISKGILLSRSAILNPVISVALVAYESFRAVSDYRHGALNALGYQMSRTDVGLRVGKNVALAGIGMGIGKAVGALVGLSAIPVAGQIVLTTVLSVGVGICVGTLLTRYIDRLMARWQLRSQYGYPDSEQGARRRFEHLLEERHDLSTLETCKIVQHYSDYRVACGWESPNDIDDYRATGDIRQMPVSFQHFAIVQLQRKWGFLSDRSACKKVFKVLILQHHPDRGGSTEMAALLNRDYELYAFCQGWDEDCPSLLNPEGETEGAPNHTEHGGRIRKRNAVVDFFRSLFRQSTTSDVEAGDLHQFGLLTLEAGIRGDLHRLDELEAMANEDSNTSLSSPNKDGATPAGQTGAGQGGPSGAAKQRSIARVLSVLQQTYQTTSETVIFCGLVRASEDTLAWATLRKEVVLFNRMQSFIRVFLDNPLFSGPLGLGADGSDEEGGQDSRVPAHEHTCQGFTWRTVDEALERRETARAAIVGAVFTKHTCEQLETALGLWQSAQSLTQSYFKQCAAERQMEERSASVPFGAAGRAPPLGDGDGTGQTLETLLSIQRGMQKLSREVRGAWGGKEGEWAAGGVQGYSTLMDDMREVGLTASFALAGEHAKTVVALRKDDCDAYFRGWAKKRRTIGTVLRELRSVKAERKGWQAKRESNAVTAEEADEACDGLQHLTNNFTTQLVLLQQEQAEADAKVTELAEVCSYHLPEAMGLLSDFPSTCTRCVDKESDTFPYARRLAYERERTLMCYQRVELEAPSRMVPPPDLKDAFPREKVHINLFKAIYTDALTGTVSYCWLKSCFFPTRSQAPATSLDDIDTSSDDDGDVEKPSTTELGRRTAQGELVQEILDTELIISNGCSSRHVLSPTDVFCDPEKRRIFFQIPRGATQQRFNSVYDVRKRIRPLGLRWLLDAMQSLVDLHSCQLSHGRVSLSSFTFDDFGNTALGFFDAARRLDTLRDVTDGGLATEEMEKDVIDFGAMLLAEVLPYLFGGAAAANVGSVSPPPEQPSNKPVSPSSAQAPGTLLGAALLAKDQHTARVFKEVGERLIGKEEPRWTLKQARTFVRRCLQFNFETDEKAFLFTKEITYPPYWGPPRALSPQLITRDKRVKVGGLDGRQANVFLNVNVPLWETYWSCRRTMSEDRMGTYSTPLIFQTAKVLLPCSDDCEVNECFLWLPCQREEEVWRLCQSGFERVRRSVGGDREYKDTAVLHLDATTPNDRGGSLSSSMFPFASPTSPPTWGVICRVAVGTVVSTSANPSFVAPPPDDEEVSTADKIMYAAKRRCHLEPPDTTEGTATGTANTLLVPCPWCRCYPEYAVRIDPPSR